MLGGAPGERNAPREAEGLAVEREEMRRILSHTLGELYDAIEREGGISTAIYIKAAQNHFLALLYLGEEDTVTKGLLSIQAKFRLLSDRGGSS